MNELALSPELNQFKRPEVRQAIFDRGLLLAEQAQEKDIAIFLDKSARPVSIVLEEASRYLGVQCPDFRFVNIGLSKIELIQREIISRTGQLDRYKTLKFIELLNKDDVRKIFGNNITNLRGIFDSSLPKKGIIVDDCSDTGATRTFALRMTQLLNPKSDYSYFAFVDYYSSGPFLDYGPDIDESTPLMPWGRWTGLQDDPDPRVFLSLEANGRSAELAEEVRSEIRKIFSERQNLRVSAAA